MDRATKTVKDILEVKGNQVYTVTPDDTVGPKYRKLTASPQKLSAFFRESPLAAVALDLRRDVSPARGESGLA